MNFFDALDWFNQTLVGPKEVLTKVILNGEDLDFDKMDQFYGLELNSATLIELQIDEAKDLSVQTLETLKDFASVVIPRIDTVAVGLYEDAEAKYISEFYEMMQDMEFIFDLRFHLNGILDPFNAQLAAFEGLCHVATVVKRDLTKLQAAKKWPEVSISLVGRLKPFLAELIKEIEELQVVVNNSYDELTPITGT